MNVLHLLTVFFCAAQKRKKAEVEEEEAEGEDGEEEEEPVKPQKQKKQEQKQKGKPQGVRLEIVPEGSRADIFFPLLPAATTAQAATAAEQGKAGRRKAAGPGSRKRSGW